MKAFVTGGTGFIGQHVVRKLVARGYDVIALARSDNSAARLRELGTTPAPGDITDTESMRAPMQGSDLVFHIAGWYEIGSDDWMQAEILNVGGTRKVLRLAHELGVPKIVYVSTVAVFGDTGGELVDETYHSNGPFLSEYDRTKWLAHYKVAVPLIEKGAPIIIAMPGGVYGPGDHSWIGEAMRLFYRGVVPILPGPETTLTYAHVEDIAEGIILCAEKGQIGESYVLAGPAVPLGEMVDFWSYLTGKRAPAVRIPASAVRPLAPVAGVLGSVATMPLVNREITGILGATYMARADKARSELGWNPRPLQTGMLETFEWIAATTPAGTGLDERQRKIALLAAVSALTLFLLWLFSRRNRTT